MPMLFSNPNFLVVLLIALPLAWWVGFPRYRYRRGRDTLALIFRTLLLLFVGGALAGVQIVQSVERQAVVFVLDASDSVGAGAIDTQIAYIESALQDKPIDDEWAVVVFGAQSAIDKPLSNIDQFAPIRTRIQGNQSDIASALQTAISLFPSDVRRRIVLMTDGVQTIGDAIAKAELADASGVEISYVPLVREALPDVRVVSLDAPERVVEGQTFDINITLSADSATQARLLLFSGSALISEQDIALNAGTTRYTLTQDGAQSGFLNFTAQIVPLGADGERVDAFSQNNQLASFTQITGAPRVLVVASDESEISALVPAMTQAGLQADVVTPSQLPADVVGLADYRSVIIANVPASDLNDQQMIAVDSWVRELGGGLVFIGGPDSFGPGGYYETTLEDTLPVETQIRDQQRIPQLTIVYLIDRSGSMAVTDDNGIPNLELAKRAIDLSLELLQPTDRAGVATFDTGGAWVANLQDVEDRRAIQALVGSLRPGGGTDILSGLSLVQVPLRDEPSERKHLILLTDGETNPSGLVAKTAELRDEEVTLTVIGLNGGTQVLQDMAQTGGGNFHPLTDLSNLPTILASETVLATRSYIVEEDFVPAVASTSPMLAGIQGLPVLRGYVATTAKDTSQVVLVGSEPFRDPILTGWQYGLGRAVAFTSDATSRWAESWLTWGDFTRWWGQVINWTITESANNNIETRISMAGERARISVDARSAEGTFLNGLILTANVVAPDGTSQSVTLQQIAPGSYEATFVPQEEGAYFVALQGADQAGETFNSVEGWVMSYSPEYTQSTLVDEALLTQIASMTGGRDLTDTASEVFAPTTEPRIATAPLAPLLLLLALLLLPLDIAVRRLLITRRDLALLWATITPERVASVEQAQRLSTLQQARDRARQRTAHSANANVTPTDLPSSPDNMPAPKPMSPRDYRRRTGGDASTVSALLKRKRDTPQDDD
jgi:Mg-chelatase subunit ChlD